MKKLLLTFYCVFMIFKLSGQHPHAGESKSKNGHIINTKNILLSTKFDSIIIMNDFIHIGTIKNEKYYFYSNDSLISGKEYDTLLTYKLILPKNADFSNLYDGVDTLKYVTNAYHIKTSGSLSFQGKEMKNLGKSCAHRVVSFKEDNSSFLRYRIKNYIFVPIEAFYDDQDVCERNSGGLLKHELYGCYIKIEKKDINDFIKNYTYQKSFGINLCPDDFIIKGLIIYTYKQFK